MRFIKWEVPEPGEWLIPYLPFFIGWALFAYLWAWRVWDILASIFVGAPVAAFGYLLYLLWPGFFLPDGFRPRLYVLEDQIGAITALNREGLNKWKLNGDLYWIKISEILEGRFL